MAMNIRFNALNSYRAAGSVGGVNGKKTSGAKGASKTGAVIADSVSISSDAAGFSEVSKLHGAIRGQIESSGRAERISSLKEAVKSGNYSVSSDLVADAILDRFI